MRLIDQLPADADPLELYDHFAAWAAGRGVDLYPHQEEAALELMGGANVILATPTGSGKSLVGVAAHLAAFAQGRRTFYTAPIKALVSEKFFDLIERFGADNVGMLTGDAQVNGDAPIICATAEVLANLALRQGAASDIGQVVMDEFHYYGDRERGWAWQVPLIELPGAQFLLMSATLGDVTFFQQDLQRRTGRETVVVSDAERPVPLDFSYVLTPVHETIEQLLYRQQAPVYVVHSTQAAAMDRAQALMSTEVCAKDDRARIKERLRGVRFRSTFGKVLQRHLQHGIGVHHAGMLPRYRRLVEQLAQEGHLRVICGTDTLGVGVNMPIRTVLLTSLTKFDGRRVRVLRSREFHQIVGRAGRAGFDVAGYVVAEAPEHVIENAKAAAKSAASGNKRSKPMVKKAPEGFVNWSEQTFQRLIAAPPEKLTSHFRVSHAMVLNVIARPGDAFAAMRHLLLENHDDERERRRHIRDAIAIYRSLLAAEVVERLPAPDEDGRTVRLTIDLQANFSLNQPLSTFALAALDLIDPEAPTYALDLLSVLEATLDDPRQVLYAQESKAKAEAIGMMKAEGVPYEERMERLESISWPKPLEELLRHAITAYGVHHPWVAEHALSPKSVARDMFERAMTFNEYVAHYALGRVEGTVLRYLADAYKAMRQTVPEDFKTEEVHDLEAWLGEAVRQTDSSLLEEWEHLRNPDVTPQELVDEVAHEQEPAGITTNERAFRVLVRNALFRRVELAAMRRWAELGELDGEHGWSAERWQEALAPYWAEHDQIGIGATARGSQFLAIQQGAQGDRTWVVRQTFEDPAGDHDWGISAEVDLDASDAAGVAVVRVTSVDQL